MQRFRRKSETGRSQVSSSASSSDTATEHDTTPQIPLPDDFRTSLILPDLSRRFSLLRTPAGDPVGLEVLRNRLAEQRVRGAENQISEEEEEMILTSLRFRSKAVAATQSSEERLTASGSDNSLVRQSVQSTSTVDSSLTPSISSSPSPRSTKRYSNNLFGSGKFRDYSYIRNATKNGSARTQSLEPGQGNLADDARSATPESSAFSLSVQSSPSDKTSPVPSASLIPPSPYGDQLISVAEYRISKTLGPAGLKRASMALEEVIKEIEEAEDEIVIPRSTPIPRTISDQPLPSRESVRSSLFEAPMAISIDNQVQSSDVTERRASPAPARILPGYIPGMPRPMTPRDFDPDEQRSHSTTPRATSPNAASFADISTSSPPLNISVTRPRRDSASSQLASRSPTSPLFLQRSTNGRFTPEDGRKPASPLSGAPYQPMTVSSRPGTPSNIIWNVPKSSQKSSNHSRNESGVSDDGTNSSDAMDRHQPGLRPPPIDGELSSTNSSGSSPIEPGSSVPEERPSSKMSAIDLSSPMRAAPRSLTPTQNVSRSPTFSDFGSQARSGRSASRQYAPSNLFNLGPIPPLIFPPLANSSRSSLESEGSSYHTWEGEGKDYSISLISDSDVPKPVWHDLSPSSKSSSATLGESADDDWDPEEYIAHYAGLKKSDFFAIHERLVSASIAKGDRPERAASSLRRRRPSTSQSNYSVNGREHRIASPPPQIHQPSSSTLKSGPPLILNLDKSSSPYETTEVTPPSPKTLRNRDLAKALFGKEEVERDKNTLESEVSRSNGSQQPPKSLTPTPSSHEASHSPPLTSPYQAARNPSMPKIPQTPQEEANLTREVQQRVDAATLALKKSPVNATFSPDPYVTTSRKRVSPNQISNPRLVSASTSVDTVPVVRSPSISSSSGPSKIGSRFKKLRGSLRAKNSTPVSEEITSNSLQLPPPSRTAPSYPARLNVPVVPVPSSATEARLKVTVPGPPASTSPGLKGFMARLRGKQRGIPDNSSQSELRILPLPQPMSLAPSPLQPAPKPPPSSVQTDPTPSMVLPEPETLRTQSSTSQALNGPSSPNESDDTLLKQLFEAANKIGIDQGELNALLARKGSTSSKSLLTRNDSNATRRADTSDSNGQQQKMDTRSITPDAKAPERRDEALSLDSQAPRDRPASRQTSSRKRPDNVRRLREAQDTRAPSAIIRRTIIFPDSKMTADELTTVMGKSSSGRRRGSVTSASSRSIHDRAPTPPPPRSPTSKRFSNGPSPPVPSLPANLSVPPDGSLEKPNSTYDSVYDMYSGESRSPSATPNDAENSQGQSDLAQASGSGAGVEVIQLANGETVWNIVNGLRDEEDESVYSGRASFTSEYSGEGGLQVFFKEHGRSGSKGSMSSFVSRKRLGKRPETKVFYSPSTNIGRLIEELSQGMDAGSFNFMPNRPPGHSPSSSLSTNDMTWTLEERLDEMLQTVKAT